MNYTTRQKDLKIEFFKNCAIKKTCSSIIEENIQDGGDIMEGYETIWKKWNVRGIVQGVGFRYFVKNTARALGVRGYVKNEPDGSVTIVAGGNSEQIKELFRRFMEGNGYSYISDYDEEDLPNQEYVDFHVEF